MLGVGSGGGFNSFIADEMFEPSGKVIGIDMTDAMLEKSRKTAKNLGLAQVEFRNGYVEGFTGARRLSEPGHFQRRA